MTRWLLIVTFDDGAPSQARSNWASEAARAFSQHPGIIASQASTHLQGGRRTGHLTCDLTTTDDPAARAAVEGLISRLPDAVAGHDLVGLRPVAGRAWPRQGARIKRNLLLQVRPAAAPGQVARLESALMAMPSHVEAIGGWALSRVWPARQDHDGQDHADTERAGKGRQAWTHVWEQEFPDVSAFEVDYMRHPCHWTGVDRWFDQEVPGAIVAPEFANVLYEVAGPVLTGQAA